jgi:hypothetical protein
MAYIEDVSEGEDVTYLPGSERRPAHEAHQPVVWGRAAVYVRSEMSAAMADAAIANALAILARHKPRLNPKY